MKVLLVNRYFSLVGGVERYLIDLFDALQKEGHELHILYGEGVDVFCQKGFRVTELWNGSERLDLRIRKRLEAILSESNPDVIFVNNINNGEAVTLLASEFPTVKYIHGHVDTCPDGKRMLLNPIEACKYKLSLMCAIRAHYRFCMPRSPRKAWYSSRGARKNLSASVLLPQILVASSFMKRLLVSNGVPGHKIEVLPYFTTWPKEAWAEPADYKGLLFVGRLAQGKGLLELLESMARVLVDARLDVVGDGPLRLQAEEKCRQLRLENRVTFYGVLEGEALKARYRHNAILIVPSLWPEPFGIIGLEAAMLCRPTIAFDVGGISDWLKNRETGYLVPPGNFEAMWEKLERLLGVKQQIKEMGIQAREYVASEFSIKKHITRLIEIFQEVGDLK